MQPSEENMKAAWLKLIDIVRIRICEYISCGDGCWEKPRYFKTCAQGIPVGMSICYVKHKWKRFGEILISASKAFCKSVYSNGYKFLTLTLFTDIYRLTDKKSSACG